MTVGNDKKNWLSGYKLETFTLFTKNGGNGGTAFGGQFLFIKYWESVGNTVRVDIICSDTYGFLDSLPIRSGDAIELVITHPSRKEPFEFVAKKKNRLIISDIVGATREAKREMYTLQCVTESTLSNHTTRCPEKYKGKPIGCACLIDRSNNNKFLLKFKLISQLKLNIPTYYKKKLPDSLKKIRITKPGSRFIR